MKITKFLLNILFTSLALLVCMTAICQDTKIEEGFHYFDEEDYVGALKFYSELIEAEEKSGNVHTEKLAECYNNMGIASYQMQDYPSAIAFFEEATSIEISIGNDTNVAAHLGNIGFLYKALGDLDQAREYFFRSLSYDKKIGNHEGMSNTCNSIGSYYGDIGKYDSAMYYYEQAIELKRIAGFEEEIAEILNNKALIYIRLEKFDKARKYLREAMQIAASHGDEEHISSRLTNIGLSWFKESNYDSAMYYYKESLLYSNKRGDISEIAQAYNNIAALYQQQQDYDNAISIYNKSLDLLSSLKRESKTAVVLNNISKCYLKKKEYKHALEFLDRSNIQAMNTGILETLQNNNLLYSEIYEALGEHSKSLQFFKAYTEIKDSIFSMKVHKQIADFEIRYETGKKDKEIKLLKQNEEIQSLEIKKQKILKNSMFGGLTLAFLLIVVAYWSLRQKRRDNKIIANEKEKSDELLLNILPPKVASDLKNYGKTAPQEFENVSILFSDLVNFTEISNTLNPTTLISELNDIFTAFDIIIEKYHCVRIKTIGDAYLAVCGLPEENERHAHNIANAALEMFAYLKERNAKEGLNWQIRAGAHTGRVIAGVVGIKKYIYDVFGDAINTASRLESHSEAMRLNVSEQFYNKLKGDFIFEERGEIDAKGKGRIMMYFLKSRG